MIIELHLKDPDGINDSVCDYVNASIPEGMDPKEAKLLFDHRLEIASEQLSKWVEYGEYVSVALNLDNGKAQFFKR